MRFNINKRKDEYKETAKHHKDPIVRNIAQMLYSGEGLESKDESPVKWGMPFFYKGFFVQTAYDTEANLYYGFAKDTTIATERSFETVGFPSEKSAGRTILKIVDSYVNKLITKNLGTVN